MISSRIYANYMQKYKAKQSEKMQKILKYFILLYTFFALSLTIVFLLPKKHDTQLIIHKTLQNKAILNEQKTPKISPKNFHVENKKSIFISQNDDKAVKNKLKILKATFYKNPNFSHAINLAQAYFEAKYFQKALFWTFKANKIDKNNEQSWIIFAKIKLAVHKDEEALKALQSFLLSHPEKENIKNLIKSIKDKK